MASNQHSIRERERERERERSSYCRKPVVHRWTTLPSSSWRCWWCWRGWRCNRVWLRQWFPLQSSLVQPLFHVFRVSPPPPLGNARGGLYIVVFRSSWAFGDQNGWQITLEEGTDLVGPLRYFFFSMCVSGKNIDARKSSPIQFEFRKSLKS